MLTDLQKADIRRHLGYGPVGRDANGGSFISHRFHVWHGQMEFRIGALNDTEELILLGGTDDLNPTNPHFINPADDKVYQGYLPICNFLEGQIATCIDNLDIRRAGEYYARPDEMQAKIKLYAFWCHKMADFLYIPLNESKFNQFKGRLVA